MPAAASSPRVDGVDGVDGIAELRALRAQVEETRREVNERLDALAASIDRLLPVTDAPPRPAARAPRGPRPNLRPGDDVYVPRLGGSYPVVEAPPASETLKVQAGPIRVELRYDEVWSVEDAPPPQPADPINTASSPTRPNPNPDIPAIDLHGYSEANALITLELFLHHEYARRTPRVRVIHGKGNGILRDAMRRELARSSLVRAIDTGPQFHGDDGVTLADLDL